MNHFCCRFPGKFDVMFREFQVDAPESGRHLTDVLGVETLDEWEVVIVHHHMLVIDDVVVVEVAFQRE